jgi:hypothetical protein
MKIIKDAVRTNYAHNRPTSSIINRKMIVIRLKNLVKDHNTIKRLFCCIYSIGFYLETCE